MKKFITFVFVVLFSLSFTANVFADVVVPVTPDPVIIHGTHGHPGCNLDPLNPTKCLSTSVTSNPTPSKAPIAYAYKFGDKGADIKTLQTFLNNQGATPTLQVDGIYGKLTQKAVNDYLAK